MSRSSVKTPLKPHRTSIKNLLRRLFGDISKLCVTYLSQKPLPETRRECRIESVKCVWLQDRNFQAALAEIGNTLNDKIKGEIISIERQMTKFELSA